MSFEVDWRNLLTILALFGVVAGTAYILWNVHAAVKNRSGVLLVDAAVLAVALLIGGTVFFNQQENRRLRYEAGKSALDKTPPVQPASPQQLQDQAAEQTRQRKQRLEQEEAQRRAQEAKERDDFYRSLQTKIAP